MIVLNIGVFTLILGIAFLAGFIVGKRRNQK